MTEKLETWKTWREEGPINPYNHLRRSKIEVSDQGRVKRDGILIDFNSHKYKHQHYYIICGVPVHRMVAILFIPNPENKPFVDHIDTNKHNNTLENLRWVTAKENNNNPLTRENKRKQKSLEHKHRTSITMNMYYR